jgi:hypothetical protein
VSSVLAVGVIYYYAYGWGADESNLTFLIWICRVPSWSHGVTAHLTLVHTEQHNAGPVHPAYNPSFSACFFSRNGIFLSQQISQQYFSAGLSAQPNGAAALWMGLWSVDLQ